MGTWRALFCGEAMRDGAGGWDYSVFLRIDASVPEKVMPSRAARGYRRTNGGHAIDGGSRLSEDRDEQLLGNAMK